MEESMKQSVEINRRNKQKKQSGEKENREDLFCSKKEEIRCDVLRTFQKKKGD